MPDHPKNKGLIRRAFQFATHKLNDPRPSWAQKPVTSPQLQRGPQLTPGGAGPVPAAVEPTAPTPGRAAGTGTAPAAGIATAFNKAGRTPEEAARLERGAKLRREMAADRETRARDGQEREHKGAAERLRRLLDHEKDMPDHLRQAAEASLKQKQAADTCTLDAFFADRAAATEATIAEAFEVGHFSDDLETMLSAAFDRAAGHEADRGNDGGRAMGE